MSSRFKIRDVAFSALDIRGIMDSRVVRHTQRAGITTLSIRASDGYINDTEKNVGKYRSEYARFLTEEANLLSAAGVTFSDFDAAGNGCPARQERPVIRNAIAIDCNLLVV